MQKYNDLCFNNFMVSWNTCLLRSGTGKILCNIIYTVIRLNYFKVIVLFLNLIKSHSSSPSKHIAIVILVVPGITRFWLSFQSDQLDSKQIFPVLNQTLFHIHLSKSIRTSQVVWRDPLLYFNQIWRPYYGLYYIGYIELTRLGHCTEKFSARIRFI